MRTFLSHDATAMCSVWGENLIAEMLSSGGDVSATSFEMSPVDCEALLASDAAADPNNPDIVC